MRSRDARHLLPVLPALVLPQQIRLIDQLLSLGEVLHAVDLVALALGDVDEVGRERAEDAAALVLRVGIILLDLCRKLRNSGSRAGSGRCSSHAD